MVIINPAPVPPFGGQAYTSITPFTYRDGLTYLEVLESLRTYIRDVLVPHVDASFQHLEDYVDSAITETQSWTTDAIAEMVAYVNEQVQLIIDNSVTVQDPLVAGLVNDPASATSIALAAKYTGFPYVDEKLALKSDITYVDNANEAQDTTITNIDNRTTTLEILTSSERLSQTALDDTYVNETEIDLSVATLVNTDTLTQEALDARYIRPPQNALKILTIGSSIAAGVGTSDPTTKSYPAQTATILNSLVTPVTMVNGGVSGDTTTQMLARLPALLSANTPGIVLIELSINDNNLSVAVPAATTYANMLAMANMVKASLAVPIFITSQTPNPAQYGNTAQWTDAAMRSADSLSRAVKALAGMNGIMVADVRENLFHATGVLNDGIHPNDKGALGWANTIVNTITKMLPTRPYTIAQFTDTFDRANSLSLGTNWTVRPGTGDVWGTTSGNAYLQSGADGDWVQADAFSTDIDLTASMGWASTISGGILVRGSDTGAGSGYLATIVGGASNDVVLYRLDTDGASELARYSGLSLYNGVEVSLNVSGNALRVSVDDRPLITAIESTYSTQTNIGLRASTPATSARWAYVKAVS